MSVSCKRRRKRTRCAVLSTKWGWQCTTVPSAGHRLSSTATRKSCPRNKQQLKTAESQFPVSEGQELGSRLPVSEGQELGSHLPQLLAGATAPSEGSARRGPASSSPCLSPEGPLDRGPPFPGSCPEAALSCRHLRPSEVGSHVAPCSLRQ